ncbi:MAG: tRNA lysidine(34) synthetase TilS [Candidatus Eisenbacteria bacterium]|nr:tRNA lysidine(34) synthetase TilS [Candidatus Eisenbacteria bacterium]
MLLAKVKNFIKTHALISNGDSVLAAVSGGPDSMALLNALAELSGELGFSLSAAHLNHGLRPEAAEEERFVLAACEGLKLRCTVGRVDARSFAAASGCSLEEAARELRLSFLAEQAEDAARPRDDGTRRRPRVALGHTLDDQAETVLMRLIRGAGTRGLSAMRPVSERPVPGTTVLGAPGTVFIRPLLSSSRQEILEFLKSRDIAYVEDASNLDLAFLRNRVRHELLGLLRERYNPRIAEALGLHAELLNEADDYLTRTARQAYKECVSEESAGRIELELSRIVAYHTCVQGYVFREAYLRLCGTLRDVGFSHIASLSKLASTGRTGDRVDLPHGVAATREGARLVLGRRAALESEEGPRLEFSVQHEPGSRTWLPELSLGVESRVLRREDPREGPGTGPGGDWMRRGTPSGGAPPRRGTPSGVSSTGAQETEAFFDLEALSLPLVLRNLSSGDTISPFGMKGSKKIQDLLVDMKVPRRERRNLAALCDSSGMLWLVGVRRGSAAPVKADTRLVLAVRMFTAP